MSALGKIIGTIGIACMIFAVMSCSKTKPQRPVDGLDDSTETAIGSVLRVEPFYGWGWSSDTQNRIDVPEPFCIRLLRLYSLQGKRVGGVGKVESPSHKFEGYWVVFSIRHVGQYNFVDHVDDYNVQVGPQEPSNDGAGLPLMRDEKPHFTGFAQIARRP